MYRVVIYVTIKSLMTETETVNNIVEVVGLVVHTRKLVTLACVVYDTEFS